MADQDSNTGPGKRFTLQAAKPAPSIEDWRQERVGPYMTEATTTVEEVFAQFTNAIINRDMNTVIDAIMSLTKLCSEQLTYVVYIFEAHCEMLKNANIPSLMGKTISEIRNIYKDLLDRCAMFSTVGQWNKLHGLLHRKYTYGEFKYSLIGKNKQIITEFVIKYGYPSHFSSEEEKQEVQKLFDEVPDKPQSLVDKFNALMAKAVPKKLYIERLNKINEEKKQRKDTVRPIQPVRPIQLTGPIQPDRPIQPKKDDMLEQILRRLDEKK